MLTSVSGPIVVKTAPNLLTGFLLVRRNQSHGVERAKVTRGELNKLAFISGAGITPGRLAQILAISSRSDLAYSHTALTVTDRERRSELVSEWKLVSYLSFAHLILWVPRRKH